VSDNHSSQREGPLWYWLQPSGPISQKPWCASMAGRVSVPCGEWRQTSAKPSVRCASDGHCSSDRECGAVCSPLRLLADPATPRRPTCIMLSNLLQHLRRWPWWHAVPQHFPSRLHMLGYKAMCSIFVPKSSNCRAVALVETCYEEYHQE
jgi:hypothetical protein